jgi:hypothetical protein
MTTSLIGGHALPVPNDDDSARMGAQRMRELAAKVDTVIPTQAGIKIRAGSAVRQIAAGSQKLEIALPVGVFTAVPMILVCNGDANSNGNKYMSVVGDGVHKPTLTLFMVTVYNPDGSVWTAPGYVRCNWIAIGT